MRVNRRPRASVTQRMSRAISDSVAGRRLIAFREELRRRHAPVHWTNLFGIVTLACVVVVFATGVALMFFYQPSGSLTRYDGSYAPLHGSTMSQALRSTLALSFDVRGGMLLRQAHHWAALLLPAAIILQLLVTFFTGAFRRPRKGMWVLLFGILIVALAGGWSGYALPDDMLSGTGLRITQGIVLGIPVVGTWLSSLLFGGEFPGSIIEHLYPLHVAIVPALLVLLLVLRARSAWFHKPAQFPAQGRSERIVVGVPLWPNHAARNGGLFALVIGMLVLFSAFVTVDPVWLYGPSDPAAASAGSQPDWYTGFLDGALRLVPPGWEFVWLGHTWSLSVLVPLAVVGLFLLAVLVYPFAEEWVTADHREHHLLDRPRTVPVRTAIGVAGVVFYGVLWSAGSADLVATHFGLSVESVVVFLQVTLVVGPIVAFILTRRVAIGLQRKDEEILLHGYETGRIVRLPGGEYVEIHRPVDAREALRLSSAGDFVPIAAHPDDDGHLHLGDRVRARLSEFFFEDRMVPVQHNDDGVGEERTHERSIERASRS
jgi:ubiquinol-cytochrome c reductase cytochrome b subunit